MEAAGRGRTLGRRQDSKESRDSSVSSTSREVRCGCQYFQSDSLLPERHTLVGTRPPSRNMGDHEYEPINPPASQQLAAPSPPLLTVSDQEDQEKVTVPEKIDFKPKFDTSEYQYLRIPLDRDLVIPIDKEEIDRLRYDSEPEQERGHEEREMTAQEIQDHMEERFFAATPTTTISRTDGEFNTSQMDSSGLDELPLKKDARRGFNAKGFQQRIQNQAGRLRTRIRNIPRPNIKFPDRSKIHLPERPKFNFPERPKFNFPERPKFNLKRPDIKMPNFNFGKTKSSSIRRPLRDKSQIPSNQSTVGSKKNLFDNINFRTYPRIFTKKKKAHGRRAMTPPPRMETESTPPSSPGSRAGAAGERWKQHFKDIKLAGSDDQSDLKKPSFEDDAEDDSAAFREPDLKAAVVLSDNKVQMKAVSATSIPGSDREQHSSGSSSERHRAGVIEEIDSDEFFLREKGLSREDVDVSRYLSLEIRDAFRSPKNALASLDKEVDDDEGYEFEPHRRATGEPIRLSMEAIRNQSLEQIRMTPEREEYSIEDEPVRPERTRSLKKRSTRSRSEEFQQEEGTQFNTFPPNRPSRVRKQSSQSKHSIPVEDYEINKENVSEVNKRQPSVPSLAITDTTKEQSPTRYIDESSEAMSWAEERQPPLPPKRRRSARDSSLESAQRYREQWLDDVQADDAAIDNLTALQLGRTQCKPVQNGFYDIPPALPARKSRSRGTSIADEDRTSRGADSLVSETRTHLTEDIPLDIKQEIKGYITDDYAVVEKTVIEVKPKPLTLEKPSRPPPPSRKKRTAAQLTALKNQSINFFFTYPRRAIKKSLHRHSPVPVRPVRNYSSIGPSRPPRRNRVFREPVYEGEYIPLKAENDIITSQNEKKTEYIEDEEFESNILEVESDEKNTEQQEVHDMRDLQSGDVIEKMKGRPLPAPPRPPRKTKEDNEDERDMEASDFDAEEDYDEDIIVERIDIMVGHQTKDEVKKEKPSTTQTEDDRLIEEICEEMIEHELGGPPLDIKEEPPIKVERRKKSLSVARASSTPAAPIEATVSTQTDMLPEGFYVDEEQQHTVADYTKSDESTSKTPQPEKKTQVETIIEHKVVVIPTPETEILKASKLHVTELDVEKLNVVELQAKKITVSEIDGTSMQVTELLSKSANLVVGEFELPSSFLEAITPPAPPAPVIQIQSATQTPPQTSDSQTNTVAQEVTVVAASVPTVAAQPVPVPQPPSVTPIPAPSSTLVKRPSPPPSIMIQTPHGQSTPAYVPGAYIPSSPPPRTPPRARPQGHDSEEDLRILPRRRRHHSQKHSTQYSSDEEDEEEYPSYPLARRAHQREPNATDLIRQLLSIWQGAATRGINHVIEGLNAAFPDGEKRKDAQTAACIVLVLLAGLIMLGFGQDKTVHHHHWDFLPPHP